MFKDKRNMVAQVAANVNAMVELANAPLKPSFLILKNTLTTMRFKGNPNRLIMTLRWLSGKYLLLKVPMEGKYIPTHASKTKQAVTMAVILLIPKNVPVVPRVFNALTMVNIANVATVIMDAKMDSVRLPLSCNALNKVLPHKQEAMK